MARSCTAFPRSAALVVVLAYGCGGESLNPGAPVAQIQVSLSPAALTLRAGESQQFTAQVSGGGSTAVTWSSGNVSIATVSSSGAVTGIGAGASTIKATSVADPNKSATAVVTVVGSGNITWVGGNPASPSEWSAPTNWLPALVPSATDTAVIGVTSSSPTLSADVTIAKVTVATGATLTVGSKTLTISAGLSTKGKITTKDTRGVGQVVIKGGKADLQGTLGTVKLKGSAKGALTGPASLDALGVGETATILLAGQHMVVTVLEVTEQGSIGMSLPSDTLDISTRPENPLDVPAATFNGNETAGTLTTGVLRIGGNLTATGGKFVSNGTKVVANGTGVQAWKVDGSKFQDLSVENTQTAGGQGVSIESGGVTVRGSLTLRTGTLSNAATMNVAQAVVLGAGTVLRNTGVVSYGTTFTNQGATVTGATPVTTSQGTYTLVTVNGRTLPYVTASYTLLSASVVLGSANNFTLTATYAPSTNSVCTGSYTQSGTSVVFTQAVTSPCARSWTAVLTGGSLTISDSGDVEVFQKTGP